MSSGVLIEKAPIAARRARQRIAALDMTKGVLVVAMVIYHSFNYSQDYTLGFKFLPFLPPSFILISGFLIARLYFEPECARDPRCHARVFLRGLRLLAIFTLLNVATQAVGSAKWAGQTRGIGYLFDHWSEIYGVGGGQFAAFSILLPIAYLLMLAPLLIGLDRISHFLIYGMGIALAVFCALGSQRESESLNLALLSAGLVGVMLGRVPASFLVGMGRFWFVSVALYGGLLAVEYAGWRTPFDQLLNACLALAAIFSICAALDPQSFLSRRLVILGRYSLLGYILQIAVLQVLVRLFGRLEPFSAPFVLEMLAVLFLLVVLVEGIEWARRRTAWIDSPYRAIFA